MATIRPDDLPAAASVNPASAIIVDDGATVEKATPLQVVDAAIPLASQAEAEAGVNNVKRVTPLRVAQAIAALGSLVSYIAAGIGAVARTIQARLRDEVFLTDFGAVGDGVTDNRAAILAFVNHLALTHQIGFAPKGRYRHVGEIGFPATYGWGIRGAGTEATIFEQATDNVPVFDLGATAVDSMHSYVLENLQLTYANAQPAANTNANCILYTGAAFQGRLNSLRLSGGRCGIKVVSGQEAPWGEDWDDIKFNGLSGGAMDWTGALSATPNNKWGRFLVDAVGMTDAIFKNIRGYNFTINTIELLQATNIPWFTFQSGSEVEIGALKLEQAVYDGATTGNGLFDLGVNSSVRVGSVSLGGTDCILTPSASTALFKGSTGSRLEVGHLTVSPSEATSNFYLCGGGAIEYWIRKKVTTSAFPIPPLTDIGSTVTANTVTVWPDKNDRLSDDKGDANYTIVQGDPGMIMHETAFTAARADVLPVDGVLLFNGLLYRHISSGAVNGTNTLAVTASGNTKATLSDPYGFVETEWRRHPTPHLGWKVIGAGRTVPLMVGSATYDPPSVAAAGVTTTTVTVTGAVVGDVAQASFSLALGGLMMSAEVSAANTVTATLFNPTAAPIDLASGTLRATVVKVV